MKRRPYRLQFRPVRRPYELKLNLDFNLKPSVMGWAGVDFKPDFRPAAFSLEARPITAADVVRLAEAIKPAAAVMRDMAQAFRVASILPAGYLERLREAMDKEAQEEKLTRLAWLEEASQLSAEKWAELRIGSVRLLNPAPHIFISSGY
jgi:hypothetical protein